MLLVLAACLAGYISLKYKTTDYPIPRTLEDSSGRSIPALILSKHEGEVIIERTSDHSEYLLQIEKLSKRDQRFLSGLSNDVNFQNHKKKVERENNTRGRMASWARMIENAKREAQQYDIPVLLAFLHSQEEESVNFDRYLLDSKEFRTWAHGNVVLCRYYNDPEIRIRISNVNRLDQGPSKYEVYKNGELQTGGQSSGTLTRGGGLNGLGAKEGRSLARSYGVGSVAPVLLLLKPSGNTFQTIHPSADMEPDALLDRIYAAIYPERVAAEMTFLQKVQKFFTDLFG